jgi:hypothetical protein
MSCVKEISQNAPEIAVFPRTCIEGYCDFVPWIEAGPLIRKIEKSFRWMRRDEAEKSANWIQPIPCALILQNAAHHWTNPDERRYSVLKRIKGQKRNDLSARIP